MTKQESVQEIVEILDGLSALAEMEIERINSLPAWLNTGVFLQQFKEDAELEIQAYAHIKQIIEEM